MKRRGRGLFIAIICIALSAGWLATPIGEIVTRRLAGVEAPGGAPAGEQVTASGSTGRGASTTNDLIAGGGSSTGGDAGAGPGSGPGSAPGAEPAGGLASLDVLKLTLDGLNVLIGLIGLALAGRALSGSRGGG